MGTCKLFFFIFLLVNICVLPLYLNDSFAGYKIPESLKLFLDVFFSLVMLNTIVKYSQGSQLFSLMPNIIFLFYYFYSYAHKILCLRHPITLVEYVFILKFGVLSSLLFQTFYFRKVFLKYIFDYFLMYSVFLRNFLKEQKTLPWCLASIIINPFYKNMILILRKWSSPACTICTSMGTFAKQVEIYLGYFWTIKIGS